jgi:cytochrome P450
MAGADSTSIGMRSVFYFLMKNPEKLVKVRAEIDAAFADGTLTSPVQYAQSSKLPYLNAVIKESFRVYSPFAAPFPRYSPHGGIVLAGTHIAAGMRVGLNPAVVQHHPDVFGDDAKFFRPERWLESNTDKVKLMERSMMAFGAGTRRCTGRNVSRAISCYRRSALTHSDRHDRDPENCSGDSTTIRFQVDT